MNRKEEILGILEISEEVIISEDERMQVPVLNSMNSGKLLTLHLANGRRLDVFATQGLDSTLNGIYRVVPGNLAGFVSE